MTVTMPAAAAAAAAAPSRDGGGVSIPEGFAGQAVLVTGANGYLGSLLVEQLLRTVPDIRRIYMLASGLRGSRHQRGRALLVVRAAR
jgi:hypothetical protein